MKRMKKLLTILFALLLAGSIAAREPRQVVWFDGRHPITYSVPADVEPVVTTALAMWKDDMRQVTGMEPVAAKKATVRVVQGTGAADGFRISVSGGQIVVEGNNGRGMA